MDAQVAGMIVNALIVGTAITVVGYLGIRTFQVFRKDSSCNSSPRRKELTEELAYIKLKEVFDKYNVKYPDVKAKHLCSKWSLEIRFSKKRDMRMENVHIFGKEYALTHEDMIILYKCLLAIKVENDSKYEYFDHYYLTIDNIDRINNLEFWDIDKFIKS